MLEHVLVEKIGQLFWNMLCFLSSTPGSSPLVNSTTAFSRVEIIFVSVSGMFLKYRFGTTFPTPIGRPFKPSASSCSIRKGCHKKTCSNISWPMRPCRLSISNGEISCARMHADLMENGIITGRHRIAQLMRNNDLKARQ